MIDVTTAGAVGDGVTDDAPAINAALALDSIFIPRRAQPYLIGSELKIPSDRTVLAEPGAVLKRKANTMANGQAAFFRNANFDGNRNIQIYGGEYDGDNTNNAATDGTEGAYPLWGGVGFRFVNVTNLMIATVKLTAITSFNIQLGGVKHFVIQDITLNVNNQTLHEDGIHINGSCEHGTVNGVYSLGALDDLIALNADDLGSANLTPGNIRYITVENVICANALGPGVRLLNVNSNIEHIIVRNFKGGFTLGRVVTCTNDGGTGTGIIDDVLLENFDVQTRDALDAFMWWNGLNGGTVTLRNIKWRPGNGTPEIDPFTGNAYGHGQFILEMPAGTITELNIQHATATGISGGKPLVLDGLVQRLNICGLATV